LFGTAIAKFTLGVVLVGALIFLAYPFIISKRLLHEEAFLQKELPGYEAYCEKVRYRLIPFIW